MIPLIWDDLHVCFKSLSSYSSHISILRVEHVVLSSSASTELGALAMGLCLNMTLTPYPSGLWVDYSSYHWNVQPGNPNLPEHLYHASIIQQLCNSPLQIDFSKANTKQEPLMIQMSHPLLPGKRPREITPNRAPTGCWLILRFLSLHSACVQLCFSLFADESSLCSYEWYLCNMIRKTSSFHTFYDYIDFVTWSSSIDCSFITLLTSCYSSHP